MLILVLFSLGLIINWIDRLRRSLTEFLLMHLGCDFYLIYGLSLLLLVVRIIVLLLSGWSSLCNPCQSLFGSLIFGLSIIGFCSLLLNLDSLLW
ncbi:hypothetical protein Goklo_007836 [Gossypium klotzschianum]|uniref:Uncharacterized protein n=1 Tax=Gossypium klotzschianum TaxID=34286 RepID=A0A7J8UXW8_9ROSI|nr:hypothetical protein [Gossypium klotzschianum]